MMYWRNWYGKLKPEWVIPFKAKAWLDLRKNPHTDSANIKKHRNDILRIASEIVLPRCVLPEEVRKDMEAFVDSFDVTEAELKSLKIYGTKVEETKAVLREIYLN